MKRSDAVETATRYGAGIGSSSGSVDGWANGCDGAGEWSWKSGCGSAAGRPLVEARTFDGLGRDLNRGIAVEYSVVEHSEPFEVVGEGRIA
jgi:hypothetical protein